MVTAKADALERVRVLEETAAASWAGWTLREIAIAGEVDETHTTINRLNTDLMSLRKQVSAHVTVQFETHDAQDESFRFEARWKSAREHVKATEQHLAQVT